MTVFQLSKKFWQLKFTNMWILLAHTYIFNTEYIEIHESMKVLKYDNLHFLWKKFSTSIFALYAETIFSVDYLISITCCFIWSWWCDLVCGSAGQRYLKFNHTMLQFKKEYSKRENSRFAKQWLLSKRKNVDVLLDINVIFIIFSQKVRKTKIKLLQC